MKSKHIFSLFLCLALIIGICSCSKDDTNNDLFSTTAGTKATTEAQTTSAPEEDEPPMSEEEKKEAERVAFLESVTYLDYEFTGDQEPYFFGRWFEQTRGANTYQVSVTAGSTIHFLIQGAKSFDVHFVEVTQLQTPYFSYSIDGADPIRQKITSPTVELPDAGVHTVRIIADGLNEHENKWMREEGFALKDIVPAEGGEIYGIRPTNKVIFFYGDSITEGISALPGELSTADSNSGSNTYAWHSCKALGAVPYMIAYGGSGIVASGSFNTMDKAIDFHSEGRYVDDGIVPDIIVINHGTNDKRLSASEFEPALEATLGRLRAKYPNTPIVYLIPLHQAQVASIHNVMKNVENSYVIETADWKLTYTDTVHLDAAGAKTAGEKLANALTEIFGKKFFA